MVSVPRGDGMLVARETNAVSGGPSLLSLRGLSRVLRGNRTWQSPLSGALDTSTLYDWDIPGGNVGKTVWYRGAWETHTLEISRRVASGLADSGPRPATPFGKLRAGFGSPDPVGKPAKATVTG